MPAAVKQPQDHLPTAKQRQEVLNEPCTFTWDDEEWTVVPADATALEFIAFLEDDRIIHALRFLLGKEQADRLIKGRRADQLKGFFDALGEAVGTGNP